MGARVIQLIGAILPRAVSLVIGLVGDTQGGGETGRQHAPVVNLPTAGAGSWLESRRKGHWIVSQDLAFTSAARFICFSDLVWKLTRLWSRCIDGIY